MHHMILGCVHEQNNDGKFVLFFIFNFSRKSLSASKVLLNIFGKSENTEFLYLKQVYTILVAQFLQKQIGFAEKQKLSKYIFCPFQVLGQNKMCYANV